MSAPGCASRRVSEAFRHNGPRSSVGIEQQRPKLWVTGSNPVGVAISSDEISFIFQHLGIAAASQAGVRDSVRKVNKTGFRGHCGTLSPAKSPAMFPVIGRPQPDSPRRDCDYLDALRGQSP
jgi:hypothetical protein